MFNSKMSFCAALQVVLLSITIHGVSASDTDVISQKCALADAAENSGKLDEAEKNLVDALQLSWNIALVNSKAPSEADKAKIAAMTQDEKIAMANKEYSDSVSDVVIMSIPMALGELCSSYEKAGQYDKVVEIHEWLVKNDEHRGGDDAEFNIATNQIMMAKAALQGKDRKKSSAYYACAIADETALRKKMSAGQMQNFAGSLKDYSEALKTTGASDEAAVVLAKSKDLLAASNAQPPSK